MGLYSYKTNKNLRGQQKEKLYAYNRHLILNCIESRENQKKRLKLAGDKNKGPRREFLEYIEKDDISIETAMNKIFEKIDALKEKDLIGWMREELAKGNFSEKTMNKIKKYLEERNLSNSRKNDDDAR